MLKTPINRRGFIGISGAAVGFMAAGCTSLPGLSMTDAIRRLLTLSSTRAFARMTAENGFWDNQVEQLGLGNIMGASGGVVASLLTTPAVKARLSSAFAGVAAKGAERAAPIVADAVRTIGIQAAREIIAGGPTAATEMLRGQMGSGLVTAMVPELGQAMSAAQSPVISQAIARLTGVNSAQIADRLSSRINEAIWQEIGVEESAIRKNPRATKDPLLIGVFGVASKL